MIRCIALIIGCAAGMLGAATVNFDEAQPGQAPPGWSVAITGQGTPDWRVEREASAPSAPQVLKQAAETPNSSFPLCLKDDAVLKDGFVEVKFKTLSGKKDQAAGVVWRARDKDTYYICRANALEDNVVLYRVKEGKRTALDIVGRKGGYGVDEKVAPARWHRLRAEFAGARVKVIFDGKPLFEVEDGTFSEAGKVGLWTKADSVTLFDDFRYGEF
jgi:hypothetical protein